RTRSPHPDPRARLLQAAGREVGACRDRSVVMPSWRRNPAGPLDGLRQIFETALALAEQDPGVGEMGASPDGREEQIVFSADRERALEEGDGCLHLSAKTVDIAEASVGR